MVRAVLWQRVEGLMIFAACLALFWHWNQTMPWWAALPLFFAPDLSFLGYLLGPRIGAFGYNFVHVYAFGLVLIAIGLLASIPVVLLCGTLWLAHSGFDRVFGYGLKSPEGFTITHLGRVGKDA